MSSSEMEMDTAESPAPAPAPASETAEGRCDLNRQSESPWSLLSTARQLLTEGQPTLALQAVLSAIRSEGGDHAVLCAMSRAREMYRQQAQSDAGAAELASLLAHCAIAEASPNSHFAPHPNEMSNNSHSRFAPHPNEVGNSDSGFAPVRGDPKEMLSGPEAILTESGRKQIIFDAFSDGSSFICLKCGGLFSGTRKDEHLANWCQ